MTTHYITRYVTYTRVVAVEERFREYWESGIGDAATFRKESRGYFVLLEGSYESIHLGSEKPELRVGDRVKITFEKAPDANPSEPPKQ